MAWHQGLCHRRAVYLGDWGKGEAGGEVLLGREICDSCGKTGVYDGWYYSVTEMMCLYYRRTGFRPLGPHRLLADELLGPITRRCKLCGGPGLLDIGEGLDWCSCPCCDGMGTYLDGTPEEIAEIRRRVLQEFPDALGGQG